MRNEKEMMDIIRNIAKEDKRIRAVYMNGSRTNPNVPKDIFQDYDIVYVVSETASFIDDKTWLDTFGQLLMIQEPDKNDLAIEAKGDNFQSYGFLMLFSDGNRIDLHIETVENMKQGYISDSLTVPLLDKDNILPYIPVAADTDYHVRRPTETMFNSCCNDLWWCLQNVAKGLWRDELPYAKEMLDSVVRERLNDMVSWYIGMQHDFQVSPGKMGKYFKVYLAETYWEKYKGTYSDGNYENIWDSIFHTCDLFRGLALVVAQEFHFSYPMDDDKNMTMYLQQVRELPPGAKEIF
ncbi:aminoglycoside 6-adenylyltransferase [Evansella sp. AB-rgal1]|uniref:aminoglycoside 6-adenylyltransferase n=1 Tax=Evansella sp. AB-rgal1 TaxID=3242696 RepID=UPI00359D9B14